MDAEFEKELASLLNRYSKENGSNTPDYILAQHLVACLKAFETATQQRETWYGRDARPTSIVSDGNATTVTRVDQGDRRIEEIRESLNAGRRYPELPSAEAPDCYPEPREGT